MERDRMISNLRRVLVNDEPKPFVTESRPAAVLIPLIEAGGWTMIFTRRRDDLATHKGQISFPGGSVDDGETTRQAALRETEEELGLPQSEVEVLGRIEPVDTVVSGFVITPWVGITKRTDFKHNPAEVAEVLRFPVAQLMHPSVRRDQKFIKAGEVFVTPAFDVGKDIIWGATARILGDLLTAAS